MRHIGKAGYLLVTIMVFIGLLACGSNYSSDDNPDDSETDPTYEGTWYNLSGNLFTFPDLVPIVGSGVGADTSQNTGKVRLVQAISKNMLYNATFKDKGQTGSYIGNWASNNWDDKIDFNVNSPEAVNGTSPSGYDNPPAPHCCSLPVWEDGRTNAIEVAQYVPVEPGAWYYVSLWTYSTSGVNGTIVYLDLLGDWTGGTCHSRLGINSGNFMKAGNKNKWLELPMVIQIPQDITNYTEIPYMSLRVRINNNTAPDFSFTNARIYKLNPAFIVDSGNYPAKPNTITDPTASVVYSVKVIQPENNVTLKATPLRPKATDTVTLTVTPASGDWQINKFSVTDADGNPITVARNGSTATFTMPSNHVTARVSFIMEDEEDYKGDWYNIRGMYLEMPCGKTADDPPVPLSTLIVGSSSTPSQLSINNVVLYQGQASTYNYLYNPKFETNGKTGLGKGNWASAKWNDKVNFTADSPPGTASPSTAQMGANPPAAQNPPAATSFYFPLINTVTAETTTQPDVMQRVPVEPGAYYYVSVWRYTEATTGGNMMNILLFGNESVNDTEDEPYPAYGSVGINLGALTAAAASPRGAASQWYKVSFIVKLPDATAMSAVPDMVSTAPHLELRFRKNTATGPDTWFTRAEIYKLDPASVKPFTGAYDAKDPLTIADPYN